MGGRGSETVESGCLLFCLRFVPRLDETKCGEVLSGRLLWDLPACSGTAVCGQIGNYCFWRRARAEIMPGQSSSANGQKCGKTAGTPTSTSSLFFPGPSRTRDCWKIEPIPAIATSAHFYILRAPLADGSDPLVSNRQPGILSKLVERERAKELG